MAYIIQRKDRFNVVAYDGIDPITGRERRNWHPAGTERAVAELIARRLEDEDRGDARRTNGRVDLGSFLSDVWLPSKPAEERVCPGQLLNSKAADRSRDDELLDLLSSLE